MLLVGGAILIGWGLTLQSEVAGPPEPRTRNSQLGTRNSELLKPGTEVFAVEPNRVLEVSYRAAGLWLIAHRWDVRERFTLIDLALGQLGPEVCPAGPGFETVLGQFTSLKLLRTLEAEEVRSRFKSNPPHSWAEITVRDNSDLPPFRALLLPAPDSAREALVHFQGAAYLVSFDHQVFRLLSGGCRSLGIQR